MKQRTIRDIAEIKKVTAKVKELKRKGIITEDELMDILEILYRA